MEWECYEEPIAIELRVSSNRMTKHTQASSLVFDTKRTNCIACGSANTASWGHKHKQSVIYQLDWCRDCGTGFMNPRPTFKYLLNEVYSTSGHGLAEPISLEAILAGEREYPNATIDGDTLVKVSLKYLKSCRNALDIGSGYGFYSKVAREVGFEVTAVNPGCWENRIYYQLNRKKPIEEPFETVQLESYFDLVIMSQVLEHIHNPRGFVEKAVGLLNPQGIIAVAVPNFRWILVRLLREKENGVLWVPEHLNYFTEVGLRSLLTATGLKVLAVHHVARLPYHTVSQHLRLSGLPRIAANNLVRVLQWLPMRVLERLKSGVTIQIWATPSHSA